MEKNRSQNYNFAFEAIPLLFHSQTNGFMEYVEKKGVDFLKFWWNHVGDRMDEPKRVSPLGLTYYETQFDKKTRIFYITLPTPRENGDAYFLACVGRPEKRFGIVRLPNTAVYVLSRKDEQAEGHRTAFGELTPRARYRELGVGLKPTKQDFQRVVENRLRRKK